MTAKLHFRYGAMGSSKTALALMMAYNYREKGRHPLLCKPASDKRTNKMWSRVGLESDCVSLEDICEMTLNQLALYDCLIVDEIQFATKDQVDTLAMIVDHLNIPVFAYGLKTDYNGELFEGSKRILELADAIEEVETTCWCGEPARFSARIDEEGHVIRDEKALNTSDNNPTYISLCRKHFLIGRIKP